MDNPKTPARKGRPPKALLEKKNPVGRPKGDNTIIEEFKARLLASPKSQKVFDSILNAALNDDHKNQAAAWKLLMDRMLPVSYFEKNNATGARPAVNITISGIGGNAVEIGNDNIIDAEDTYNG